MAAQSGAEKVLEILNEKKSEILSEWLQLQSEVTLQRRGTLREDEVREQSREFLDGFITGMKNGNYTNILSSSWDEAREVLVNVSRLRAKAGFSPTETALFVFLLKQPIFTRLREAFANDAESLANETWVATLMIDRLGLYTTEVYQKGREEIILRQQQEMMELSTPVVSLWEGVLALPLIGTLDSARTQVVMESLLQAIVDTGAGIAIIDITGVPMVDTLVAQHLLKTVAAARLMGADCILSGIRPQIAQTIVHLGVDLGDVITKATLADAFGVALQRNNMTVTRASSRS